MTKITLLAAAFALTAAAVQASPAFIEPVGSAAPAKETAPTQQIAGYCDWITTFENGGGDRPAWCGDTEADDDAGLVPTPRGARA